MAQQLFEGLPPDQWAEAQALRRKQELAQALLLRSLQGLQAPNSGGPMASKISPFAGLAQMGTAYIAGRQRDEVDKGWREFGERHRAREADEIQRYLQGTEIAPEIPIPDDTAGGGPGRPALRGQTRESILRGLISQVPSVREIAKYDLQEANKIEKYDAGDKWITMKGGKIVAVVPKNASPDAVLREQGANRRHITPSGDTVLREDGSNQRHVTPSGDTILREKGAWGRHVAPSGSARLSASVAMRGQDMSNDPTLQGQISSARAFGKETAEAEASILQTGPAALDRANRTLMLIDTAIGDLGKKSTPGSQPRAPHPGFGGVVGWTWKPGMRFVEGSPEAGFAALLEQIQGGAFLDAYETLRGTGQVTQIEGEKATTAITRARKAQSEREFVQALREFETAIRPAIGRVQTRLQSAQQRQSGAAPAGAPQQPISVDW